MKNAMQLKAVIKSLSKKKNISSTLVLQNYMLERFLERVSLSKYRDNYIIKGGFLIASMVGLDSRATMDMDVVKDSDIMKRQWDNYRKDFGYAAGIEFKETCDDVVAVMNRISGTWEGI